ncbi:MAG: hypothetical protein R3F19_03475 [Verrucomicrobiales bacterium]
MAFEPSIYIIESIGSGFLAVMARPVPGEWVDDEFAGIAAFGISRVVSLLESHEANEIGPGQEADLCERHNMEFVSYPIRDRELPESVTDFALFTHSLYESIGGGTNTVVHCRAGIVAAGVLLHSGFEPDAAFQCIATARGMAVPDTEEQRQWISDHRHAIEAHSQNKKGCCECSSQRERRNSKP